MWMTFLSHRILSWILLIYQSILWMRRIPVPGQMTYLVASLTPDSARSYVMQGASFTQGTISTIPFVGSISPEGFLPPILLLMVIIAMVVVVAFGGVPSILKLSFMFLMGLLVLAIVAACASRVVATLSATSFLIGSEIYSYEDNMK
ncbi:hypothetical protein Tco_1082536 [Tanacetum coccineum]|uniref:Uncharacterized protein n=1 Tax=Tanacetum coccineum TaxID=301880 RepID=A0ABQ5I0N0_9ASTR